MRPRLIPPALLLVVAVLTLLPSACARQKNPHWPVTPGAPRARVTVYYNPNRHSMIELPATPGAAKPIEDWAYGEMVWIWDNQTKFADRARGAWEGTKGMFHALFWPRAGVVEVGRGDRPYTEMYPDESIRGWVIEVSPEGLEHMRAWLAASRATDQRLDFECWQDFYPSRLKYHMFFTCHHYVANALRQAGVTVRTGRCWLPWGFWSQLDKFSVHSFHHEGVPPHKVGAGG